MFQVIWRFPQVRGRFSGLVFPGHMDCLPWPTPSPRRHWFYPYVTHSVQQFLWLADAWKVVDFPYFCLNSITFEYLWASFHGFNEKKKSLQLCLTLCDPTDCSPPGSSVHGVLQARTLEWAAIPFSRGSSRPRDWTWVSWTASGACAVWVAREAPLISNKAENPFTHSIDLCISFIWKLPVLVLGLNFFWVLHLFLWLVHAVNFSTTRHWSYVLKNISFSVICTLYFLLTFLILKNYISL